MKFLKDLGTIVKGVTILSLIVGGFLSIPVLLVALLFCLPVWLLVLLVIAK